MLVGILYEGELDMKPISRLVEMLANDCGVEEVIEFVGYPASGQTLPKFIPASIKFKQENVDIFITHIDTDGDSSRKQTYDNLVNSNQSAVMGMECVSLIADPHFENFYCKEETSVKHFFDVSGEESLTTFGETPKGIVENLIRKRVPEEFEFKKNSVIYECLMTGMDLNILAQRDSNYRNFRQEIIRAFEAI